MTPIDLYREYTNYLKRIDVARIQLGIDLLQSWLDSSYKFYGSDREQEQYDRLRIAWHNAELCRRRPWLTTDGFWVDEATLKTYLGEGKD